MNAKQRITVFTAVLITVISFGIWIFFGSEIWTKTEILVEVKDELFGTTYKEWQDKFIWGLDITLILTGITLITSSILLYIFKTKEKK